MITHTIDSYQVPSQNETKSQIWKIQILLKTLPVTHLLKLLNKMGKYEMDPVSIVELQSRQNSVHRQMWNQHTPFQLCWSMGIKRIFFFFLKHVKDAQNYVPTCASDDMIW